VIKTIHGHPQRHKVCRPGKPSSDLSIELTPSVDHITAGNAIAYRIKVQNQGKYFVPGVVVSIDIPAQGSAFVSEGSGFCLPEPGEGPRTITCRLGTLPPPETSDWPPPTVIIARRWAGRAGSFAVKARVQSASARDPRPANNRAEAQTAVRSGPASADLSVSVDTNPNPAPFADDFTDTVTITNEGPSEVTPAYVTLLLPQGTEFVGLAGLPQNDSPACFPFPGGSPGTMTLCIGVLESGQTVTARLSLITLPHTPPVLETNAFVTSGTPDPDLANNRATSTAALAPFHPTVGVDLVLSLSPPGKATAGHDFELTFEVVNQGAETAQDVHVVIQAPREFEFNHGALRVISEQADRRDIRCSGASALDCKFPSLSSGGRIRGSVVGKLPAAGAFSATSAVSSSETDSDPADNTATVDFSIGSGAG